MAQYSAHSAHKVVARATRIVGLLTVSLMLSACAQSGVGELPGLFASNTHPPAADDTASDIPHSELEKATAYWGQQYAKQPRNLKAALSYARNLKALGEKQKALAVLQQAGVFHADSKELAGEYGRLALELDQIRVAQKLLEAADDPSKPDWRIISARGTALAKQGKFAEAVPFFERALTLKHNHPSLLNNLAMAHAMNGRADKAETLLRQATQNGTPSPKVHQNLALVLGLQGKYDESKQVGVRTLPATKAAENAALLKKLVRLDPVVAPSVPSTRIASTPLKPTATPAAASGGWQSKVATAAPEPVFRGAQ